MERMLADLEAAQAARERAEARAEVAESVRAEQGAVTMADRLRAGLGAAVTVHVAGEALRGRIVDVGQGWLALERVGGAERTGGDDLVRPGMRLVPFAAVAGIAGLGRAHAQADGSPIGRGWSSLLRAVARSRAPVAWHLVSGETSAGTIDAVGADHVLLTPHQAGATLVLPLSSLAWLDVSAATR